MRSLLTLALLALVFTSQVGYYGIFAVKQSIVRYEQKKRMLSQLRDDELEMIPQQKDIKFLDDGKEISLHGELYDIVRAKKINGITIFFALNDKKESHLLKKMSDAGRNHSQKNTEKKGGLKLNFVYCEPLQQIGLVSSGVRAVQNPTQPHWKSGDHTQIQVPPPNQI